MRHIQTRESAIEELLSAAEAGDLETVGSILDGRMLIDVNAGQWSPRRLALGAREHWPRWGAEAGYSALHCAAAAGHAAVCARLLERGARPGATSRRGASPLMLACYGGHVETVECLLAYMGATLPPAAVDINAMMFDIVSDGPGPSALHLAAACASDSERGAAVVAALLRAGAAAHPAGVLRALPPGSSRDPLGLLSPLHLAAAHHNSAATRMLVAAGAWAQHAGPTGETALGLAQRAGLSPPRPGVGASQRESAQGRQAGWQVKAGSRQALARAATLRELRWLPAVRTLWCVVAGAEPCPLEPCPLRRLTRDALRLVCAAVVAAHYPSSKAGADAATGEGGAEAGGRAAEESSESSHEEGACERHAHQDGASINGLLFQCQLAGEPDDRAVW